MDPLIQEVYDAQQLYREIENSLLSQQRRLQSRLLQRDGTSEIPQLQDTAAVLELESRLARMVQDSSSARLDTSREQTLNALFAQLRAQIRRLLEIVLENESMLRETQTVSHRLIQELDRGAKYIRSVRAPRESHPRFVDSQQ